MLIHKIHPVTLHTQNHKFAALVAKPRTLMREVHYPAIDGDATRYDHHNPNSGLRAEALIKPLTYQDTKGRTRGVRLEIELLPDKGGIMMPTKRRGEGVSVIARLHQQAIHKLLGAGRKAKNAVSSKRLA